MWCRFDRWIVIAVLLVAAVIAPAITVAAEDGNANGSSLESLLGRAEDNNTAPEKRLSAARAALARIDEANEPSLAGRAHLAMGEVFLDQERFSSALNQLHAADRLLAHADDPWRLYRTRRLLGDAQYRLASYELAAHSYLQALDALRRAIAEQDSRTRRLAEGHLEVVLGNTHRAIGDTEQALADYRHAGAIYEREGYALGAAGVELNIANILADEQRNAEAVTSLRAALKVARELGNEGFERLVLTNLAGCLIELGKLDEARALLEKAQDLAEQSGGVLARANVALKWGDLLMARGQARKAAERYREVISLARSTGDAAMEAEANGLLADALIATGQRAAAVTPLLEQRRILENTRSGSVSAGVTNLRIAYDAERHEQELRFLQAQQAIQLRNNRALLAALAFTAVLFLGTVWALRAKARLAETVARQHRELQESYETLERISRTDELTGLPNRRHALERLEAERARVERGATPFCLALADLDGFKGINDRWGHSAGDEVLREVARVLVETTRAQDLVARWGGDELLFLLPETTLTAAASLLRRVADRVEQLEVGVDSGPIRVTLSVGVTSCVRGSTDEWLRSADEALYRAKARGGACVEASGFAQNGTPTPARPDPYPPSAP